MGTITQLCGGSCASTGAALSLTVKHSLGARATVAIDVGGDNGACGERLRTHRKRLDNLFLHVIVDPARTCRARIRVRALDRSWPGSSVGSPRRRFIQIEQNI